MTLTIIIGSDDKMVKTEKQIRERVDQVTDEMLKHHGYKAVLLRKQLTELKWVLE